jgi:hypothetical protein
MELNELLQLVARLEGYAEIVARWWWVMLLLPIGSVLVPALLKLRGSL